jgi:hypothetical protein
LVNQNIAFDLCVFAEDAHQVDLALGTVDDDNSWHDVVFTRIFELLDHKKIQDTLLRERLIDLAEGTLGRDFSSLTAKGTPRRKRYDLKSLAKNYLNIELDKVSYRLGYAKYLNTPISEYPQGAVDYLTADVESALHVASRQTLRAQKAGLPSDQEIPDSAQQSKYAFALNLVSSWGMRTDLSKVQRLDSDLDILARRMQNTLKEHGLVRKEGRNAGTRDLKRTHELVIKTYEEAGLVVPLTDKGNVSTAGSVLEDIALIKLRGSAESSGTEALNADGQLDESQLLDDPLYCYSQYTSILKLQSTYLPTLYAGVQHPINTRYQTVLETGRISSFKPNMNQMPRGGNRTILQRLQKRVRECFVPRPGFLLSSVDFNQLELATLSQVLLWLFGQSKMADAINEGLDLHTLFAAEQLLHMPYAEVLTRKKEKHVADMRQLAKVANFGLGANMGAESLTEFARASYSVFITVEEARTLKEKWLAAFPEMRTYFRWVSGRMTGVDDRGNTVGDIEQFISGRVRGRARYCAVANGLFQSTAADGTLTALYELQRASYLKRGQLYGSRMVGYFYDEYLFEHPEHLASDRANIQTDIAVKHMQEACPDVKIRAAPALMRCWMKDADAVYVDGKLVPWEPK